MKLLTPSVKHIRPAYVEVGAFVPSFLQILCGMKPRAGQLIPTHHNGTIVITDALIDFEHTPYIPYDRYHEPVAFGNYLYEGITPVEHRHDHAWRCTVENVRLIRVEKAYEEPEELRC